MIVLKKAEEISRLSCFCSIFLHIFYISCRTPPVGPRMWFAIPPRLIISDRRWKCTALLFGQEIIDSPLFFFTQKETHFHKGKLFFFVKTEDISWSFSCSQTIAQVRAVSISFSYSYGWLGSEVVISSAIMFRTRSGNVFDEYMTIIVFRNQDENLHWKRSSPWQPLQKRSCPRKHELAWGRKDETDSKASQGLLSSVGKSHRQ